MPGRVIAASHFEQVGAATSYSITYPTQRNLDSTDTTAPLVLNSNHVLVVTTERRNFSSSTPAGPAPSGWTGVNLAETNNSANGSILGTYVKQAVAGETSATGFTYTGASQSLVLLSCYVIEGVGSSGVLVSSGGANFAGNNGNINGRSATAPGTDNVFWLQVFAGISGVSDLTVTEDAGHLNWSRSAVRNTGTSFSNNLWAMAAWSERGPVLAASQFDATMAGIDGSNYSTVTMAFAVPTGPVLSVRKARAVDLLAVSGGPLTAATIEQTSGPTVTPVSRATGVWTFLEPADWTVAVSFSGTATGSSGSTPWSATFSPGGGEAQYVTGEFVYDSASGLWV